MPPPIVPNSFPANRPPDDSASCAHFLRAKPPIVDLAFPKNSPALPRMFFPNLETAPLTFPKILPAFPLMLSPNLEIAPLKLPMRFAMEVFLIQFPTAPTFPVTIFPYLVPFAHFPIPGAADVIADVPASAATFHQLISEASRFVCNACKACLYSSLPGSIPEASSSALALLNSPSAMDEDDACSATDKAPE